MDTVEMKCILIVLVLLVVSQTQMYRKLFRQHVLD